MLLTTTASAVFARLGVSADRRADLLGPVTRSVGFAPLCPETAIVLVPPVDPSSGRSLVAPTFLGVGERTRPGRGPRKVWSATA